MASRSSGWATPVVARREDGWVVGREGGGGRVGGRVAEAMNKLYDLQQEPARRFGSAMDTAALKQTTGRKNSLDLR